MQYHDTDTSLARVDAHLALAHQALERMHPPKPVADAAPDWHAVAAEESRAIPATPLNETREERTAREFREATHAASDALVDHLLTNPVWRGEITSAIHGLPRGAEPVPEVRRAILGLGLMGIPPMVTWARVAKRLMSQLNEQGDEYRRHCHVVALQEPAPGTYRSQGDHGQAYEGDWQRDEPELPWWWSGTKAVKLTSYHVDGDLELAVAVWPGGTKPRAKVVRMDD